ncbi:MAG: prepilin-type N-terminal cleavage/methylation domain-containing protein [Erysipelotrichaceae bacterium]|nr:prepilin-type N-terminal cleavage/methylation domain-containing protein [Erysipelotrichaceae bacterium]
MLAKNGFTLLECLVCLVVFSVLLLLVMPFYRPVSFRDEMFVLDLLSLQTDAMVNRFSSSSTLENIEMTYHLNGNPASCNTYTIQGHKITVHLGWGRISVK